MYSHIWSQVVKWFASYLSKVLETVCVVLLCSYDTTCKGISRRVRILISVSVGVPRRLSSARIRASSTVLVVLN